MKTVALIFAVLTLVPAVGRAEGTLSPTWIVLLQGWITPEFEAASRQLIDTQATAQQAENDTTLLEAKLPPLKKDAAAEDAKVAALTAELARYDHPDETDFTTLQDAMKNPGMKMADRRALAQAFVWTYPVSAHESDAQKILQQLQSQEAADAKAAQDAAAAATANQLKLLERVKAHDLSLAEWRSFLQDKSHDEVQQYLGAPTSQQSGDYWAYVGDWTIDPSTNLKAGLAISFNGGRVQNVSPIPPR